MEVLKNVVKVPYRIITWLPSKFRRDRGHSLTVEEELEIKLRPYQNYLYKLQELLLWKNVNESIVFVIFINLIFFFLAWTQWRFYGVVIWMLLGLVLHEAWFCRIWPEIRVDNPQESSEISQVQHQPSEGMLSVPELSKCATCVHSVATSMFIYLKNMRMSNPSGFFIVMATLLLVVAKVGSAVSGFWLLYMMVMIAILTPGILFHLVPPKTRESLASFILYVASIVQPKDNETAVEEYLPEQSKENLKLFNLASGDMNDKTNASTPSCDMDVLPTEPIPSFDESSLDRDYSLSIDPVELESASQLAESPLSFRPTHFNGSSLGAALKQALADTLGSNLILGSPAPAILEHSDSEHSDSSEFELLEAEEDLPQT